MNTAGDFIVDLIIVIAVVWLMLMPLIVGAGILEFCEWREKRLREGPRHG